MSLVSIVSMQKGYLTIDSERKEVKMTKLPFDHRKDKTGKQLRMADGFLLKPMKKFMGKGIKKLTLFRPNLVSEAQSSDDNKPYVLVATYKHLPAQMSKDKNQFGFTQDTKAPYWKYTMEVY